MSFVGSVLKAGMPTSFKQVATGMQPQDVQKNYKQEEEKRKALLVSPVIKAPTQATPVDSAAIGVGKTLLGS